MTLHPTERSQTGEMRIAQIRQDLDELAVQVATGEIDEETGARLRSVYTEELAAVPVLDEKHPDSEDGRRITRSGRRMVVGGLLLAAVVGISVGLAGQFVQQRDVDATEGVVGAGGPVDLDSVSDEAMLSAINTFADDPQFAEQIPRMRFALGERKFEKGEYGAAFDQYDAILTADPPPPADLAAPTLTRVAWIVWLQDETDLAIQLLDRSLELVEEAPETLYVKSQVLWCGTGDTDGARALLERLAAIDTLADDVASQVRADLDAVTNGETCN